LVVPVDTEPTGQQDGNYEHDDSSRGRPPRPSPRPAGLVER
jgi:hypothetical protein